MSHFNPAHFPLTGTRLIEASAGTGKTYNIANLYLRLVLGHRDAAGRGFDPLGVDRILVVTFTKAATEELRGRIRDKIAEALQAFRAGNTEHSDAFIREMVVHFSAAGQLKEACRHLNRALVRMDEASIFTIHGFAVRAIQAFLFETGALAEVELSEAGSERREQVLDDLWRQLQLGNHATVQRHVAAAGFGSPADFHRYFASVPLEAPVLPALPPAVVQQGLTAAVSALEGQLDGLRQTLLAERESLRAQWAALTQGMDDNAIKAALKPVIDIPTPEKPKPTTVSHHLLNNIRKWLESDQLNISLPGGVTGDQIERLLASGKTDVWSSLVILLSRHAQQGFDERAWRRRQFLPLLVQWLQQQLATIDLASMQLDDVIRLVNRKLDADNEASNALRNTITAQWPVCMVDEFQDTDPQQFRMFKGLYAQQGSSGSTGFFMIGDPKQSIYAFRGADIFAYLDVRRQVEAHQSATGEEAIFSLGTNWRSKAQLVDATNRLFKESGNDVFLYKGIRYEPVESCETAHGIDKGELQTFTHPAGNKPLVFVGNPAKAGEEQKLNGDALRYTFARDTAQRIAALLNASQLNGQALKAGDIAVLVRSGREARQIRDALQRLNIGSVYQSQRDSVFSSSPIAHDVYHLLCAFADPANRKALKSAIATPLYRGFTADFSLLDALKAEEGSDSVWEALVDTFTAYQACWHKLGVLAALNLLLQRERLGEAMARQPDGDRLMTDFRHLGDLLQQHYLQCGAAEQLIDWYARQLKDDSAIDEDAKRIRLESDENLVKIVTIHVSKGLEYPVVFLPFFFLPWKVDSDRKLPLLHNPDAGFVAEIDYQRPADEVQQLLQNEQLAEDMRLLYVAVTRAVHRCYIGISASTNRKTDMFPLTVWSKLLELPEDQCARPDWPALKAALQARLGGDDVAYAVVGDAGKVQGAAEKIEERPPRLCEPSMPILTPSPWLITSYSQLAHAAPEVRTEGKFDETLSVENEPAEVADASALADEAAWQQDIRFTLKGSANTGECLHGIYEELALNPSYYLPALNNSWELLVARQLGRYGLLPPVREGDEAAEKAKAVAEWLKATLITPLAGPTSVPALFDLFQSGSILPELRFDFALGHRGMAGFAGAINPALQQAGLAPVALGQRSELQGIMNGAIDLVFVHDNKVYVLDYKSNTLGRSPGFYNEAGMAQCMRGSRYDLQYMIYSVAVHRYCQARFGSRYKFDRGELSFGGVYYLFIRGMGLDDYPGHGIWFTRPEAQHVAALDAAFSGTFNSVSEVEA